MIIKYKELDTVKLEVDLIEFGLKQGDIGAVLDVYEVNSSVYYRVEFVDGHGREIAMPTLKDSQVTLFAEYK